jgi:hypothetical protein
MFRAVDDPHLRKLLAQPIHHWLGVCIHNDLSDFRDSQQRLDDVMEQRLSRQQAIILARHSLAMMAHGDKGDKLHGD